MQYYLVRLSENNQQLISGDRNNWLSFSVYEPQTKSWDSRFGTYWADQLFVSGFADFEEISPQQAEKFINAYH